MKPYHMGVALGLACSTLGGFSSFSTNSTKIPPTREHHCASKTNNFYASSSVNHHTPIALMSTKDALSTSKSDGSVISITPIKNVTFPSYIQRGERLYSIEYWSRKTRVQAYVDIPPGKTPFELEVVLHGGDTLPTGHHTDMFAYSPQVAAKTAWPNVVVLFPEYAGYGLSSGTVGGPHDDYVDTVNAIKAVDGLKQMTVKLKDTYLLGISLGGDVALMVADNNPDIKAVALDSPYPGPSMFVNWERRYGRSNLNTSYALSYIESYGNHTDSKSYRINSFNYSEIKTPVLIIGGTNDPILPPSLLNYMYKKIRHFDGHETQLHFVEGGHAPYTSQEINLVDNWFYGHGL